MQKGALQAWLNGNIITGEVRKKMAISWICDTLKKRGELDIDLSNPPLYEQIDEQESRFVATISNNGSVAIRGGGEEAEYLNLSDLSVAIIAEIETAILNEDYEMFE